MMPNCPKCELGWRDVNEKSLSIMLRASLEWLWVEKLTAFCIDKHRGNVNTIQRAIPKKQQVILGL